MNQNPFEENLQDVLTKYGRDITDEAKAGKIDPVIGRDEEIRNITRILSRKTKNNPVLIVMKEDDDRIYIRLAAREGLISQKSVEKALRRFKECLWN